MHLQPMGSELIPSVKRTDSIHTKEEQENDYAYTGEKFQIVERQW